MEPIPRLGFPAAWMALRVFFAFVDEAQTEFVKNHFWKDYSIFLYYMKDTEGRLTICVADPLAEIHK